MIRPRQAVAATYPAWVTRLLGRLLFVVLAAAGLLVTAYLVVLVATLAGLSRI